MSNVPIAFSESKLVIYENVFKNKCNENENGGKTQENREITENNIEKTRRIIEGKKQEKYSKKYWEKQIITKQQNMDWRWSIKYDTLFGIVIKFWKMNQY